MPRQARVVLPGFPHHIVFRGNNRRRLFSYPRDYLTFVRVLERALHEHDVPLHAVTLMCNHGHLLVTPPTPDALSRLMKITLQRYAQYRNRQRRASGKLFEQRFHSVIIEDVRQLAAVTAYIELNPERAGMGPAASHRWTTHRLHAGGHEPLLGSLWTPSRWYHSLGRSREERQCTYRDWVASRRRADVALPHPRSADPPRPADALRIERPDRTRAE